MNNGFNPRIGFIGAGRVGTTLGKYFITKGASVAGYYSRTVKSAKTAASFTDTASYDSIAELIDDCNMLFITVPDNKIEAVWNEISDYSITGKCICHCSGAMSSSVFEGIQGLAAYGYSIHPLCAINSISESYKTMDSVFFSVEGSDQYIQDITAWLRSMGNPASIIASDKKVLYHAPAVLASNLSIGLYHMAGRLLGECGIDPDTACMAINNLYLGNSMNVVNKGPIDALTGPVDRGDTSTIKKHLNELTGDTLQVYKLLSNELIKVASVKNPNTDYSELELLLGE